MNFWAIGKAADVENAMAFIAKIKDGDTRRVQMLGHTLFSYKRRRKSGVNAVNHDESRNSNDSRIDDGVTAPDSRKSVGVAAPCAGMDDDQKMLSARQILEFRKVHPPATIQEAEMRVFSQWGEDGIIQWLLSRIPAPIPAFVEFGVENYRESNTRFLLQYDNWRGLVIDGSGDYMDSVRQSPLCWRHDLTALDAFINRDNINELIRAGGFEGEIGILSVDIDGVDYWVVEKLGAVNPQIVICEINGILGGDLAVTVPYKSDFARLGEHFSGQYFGASLKGMEKLLRSRGYSLVGINSNCVNAFFVRNDLAGNFHIADAAECWREPRHSDTRGESGELTHVRRLRDKLALIKDMMLVNLDTGEISPIYELYGL